MNDIWKDSNLLHPPDKNEEELPIDYFKSKDDTKSKSNIEIQILHEWKIEQRANRRLRRQFGWWIIRIFIFESAIFSIAFILSLFKLVTIETSSLVYWLGALVIEVIGIVTIIIKGLFENATPNLHELLKAVVDTRKTKE